MSWRILLGLILCNAVWSANPAIGKILMQDFPPLQVSWLRYFLALLSSLIIFIPLKLFQKKHLSPLKNVQREFPWLLLAGIVTFFGSAYVQYIGLSLSTPTANSLMVALEPLSAALLAWAFLKEKIHGRQYLAFFLAIIGFFLLSNIKPTNFSDSLSLFNIGNIFLLLSMPAEAMYSIVSRKLSGKLTSFTIFLVTLPIGFSLFTLYLIYSGVGIPNLSDLSFAHWSLAFWMGCIGTTITYTFWTLSLGDAPVAAVALTLFVQPIIGASAGVLLLKDHLDFWQWSGALFILFALYIQTSMEFKRSRR